METEPANYWSISLTCTCSKLLKHTIYNFISNHLSNHILTTSQHVFYTGWSCAAQLLLEAINDFHCCLDAGNHFDAVFLDFSKTFDIENCVILSNYGVSGKLLCWIKDYLTDQSQSEGKSSNSHPFRSPSRFSTIGPFPISRNNITESITSTIRLYDIQSNQYYTSAFKIIFFLHGWIWSSIHLNVSIWPYLERRPT